MLSQDVRRRFLKYFNTQSHTVVPSSSIVPHDDPSLLFINAGMNQFKDVFLSKSKREYTRATSSQKCIKVGGKHNDLENVGHTTRHLTFFEMPGNIGFFKIAKESSISAGVNIIFAIVDVASFEIVPLVNDLLRELKSRIVALATKDKTKCQIVIKVSPDVIKKGILADLMIKEISKTIDSGGGGKMDMTQAGGKYPIGIKTAFKLLRSFVEKKC